MTTVTFVRRFLADTARNPVNLLLLVMVPIVFVVVVAGSMADAAKLLGGVGGPAVETATAGWAAAFLAGIAMYFQTAATRDTDRRVVLAGFPAPRLIAARLITGMMLAALASAAALVALVARTGIDHPVRVAVGTFMFAMIYVAIGAVVGAIAKDPVTGTVIVLFIWIFDVFFGPAMGAADTVATRGLPTHFVTLWMVDLPSQHGGQLSDLGWAVTWPVVATLAAWGLVAARTRIKHPRSRPGNQGGFRVQVAAAGRAALRDAGRNRMPWVLFVLVPVVFVLAADAVTPDEPILVTLREHGQTIIKNLAMPSVHSATMAPIAIASLAAIVGLSALIESREGDRRSVLAGMRSGTLFSARVGVLVLMTLAATAVSLATTALVFHPTRWVIYAAANVLLGVTYALIGALLGPVFGRVGGVFIAFLLPFLDLGITQSPMLHSEPTTFSRLLPGYGGSRVLLDGALTSTFDEVQPLMIGLAWLAALAVAVALTYRHATRPARTSNGLPAMQKDSSSGALPYGPHFRPSDRSTP